MTITSKPSSELGRFEFEVVRRKVRRIIGRAGFTHQDQADLKQELLLRLVASLPQYDPARGCREAFVTAVVERDASNILREARAQKRDRRGVGSLNKVVGTLDEDAIELGATLSEGVNHRHCQTEPRSRDELDQLRQDTTEVLQSLTVPERILAVRLMTQSISDISWESGVPRTTVQEHVERLRLKLRGTGLAEYLRE